MDFIRLIFDQANQAGAYFESEAAEDNPISNGPKSDHEIMKFDSWIVLLPLMAVSNVLDNLSCSNPSI